MAHLYRLVLVLIGLIPCFAQASVPERTEYRMNTSACVGGSRVSAWAPFPEGVANYAGIASCQTSSTNTRSVSVVSCNSAALTCTFTITDTPTGGGSPSTRSVTFGPDESRISCPPNSVSSGSVCICDSGFKESNNQCVYESTGNSCNGLGEFCSGLKGQKINLEGKGTATPPGCAADSARPNCAMGCAGEAVGMGVSYKTSDGSWMTGQEYRVTGGTCTLPQPSDVPQKKESDCAGSVGEVNGVRTCVPNQAASGDTSSKESKNPDGTSSNTESKTTCENGVCKTTNTTTNKDASGNTTSTSTSSSTTSQREYCATNKASTVCAATNGDKNPDDKDGEGDGKCEGDDCEDKPSKFEGSCAGGFTCEGDGISCALAKEVHMRNCQIDALKDGDLYKAWETVKDFGTKNVTTDLPGNKRYDISITDRDDFLSAGSCPPDRTIELGFIGSITLPFSVLCPWLQILGYINVIVTSIVGASIIIRRQS